MAAARAPISSGSGGSSLLRSLRLRARPQAHQQQQHQQRHSLKSPRHSSSQAQPQLVRPLVAPPLEGGAPLLSRRADRALPALPRSTWPRTLPIFALLITAASLAIFNYQKSSSSTVNSILYALRTNAAARELLGDEIYFASKIPWIRGEMDQVHGNIDIRFWVKGTKGQGEVRFVSVRRRGDKFFQTLEWSLTAQEGGAVVQLLDAEGGRDPMQQ